MQAGIIIKFLQKMIFYKKNSSFFTRINFYKFFVQLIFSKTVLFLILIVFIQFSSNFLP